MKQYEWIAGVLWDVLEFAQKEGLTSVERALADAIKASEPNTGPDPRGRKLCQSEIKGTIEFFRFQPENAEDPKPTCVNLRLDQ